MKEMGRGPWRARPRRRLHRPRRSQATAPGSPPTRPACRPTSTSRTSARSPTCSREHVPLRRAHRLRELRQRLSYEELGKAAGAWRPGSRAGARPGRPRRDHAAEHARVSGDLFGALIAGCTVVNVNPLYTAARAAARSRTAARGSCSCSRTSRAGSRKRCRNCRLERVVVVGARRSHGPEGAWC